MSAGLQDISLYLCHEFGIAFNLYITNIHGIYINLSICVYIHIVIHHAFFSVNLPEHDLPLIVLSFQPHRHWTFGIPKFIRQWKRRNEKHERRVSWWQWKAALKNCVDIDGSLDRSNATYGWLKKLHTCFLGCFLQILLQNSLGRWQLFPFLWTSFCWCQIGTQELPEVVTWDECQSHGFLIGGSTLLPHVTGIAQPLDSDWVYLCCDYPKMWRTQFNGRVTSMLGFLKLEIFHGF